MQPSLHVDESKVMCHKYSQPRIARKLDNTSLKCSRPPMAAPAGHVRLHFTKHLVPVGYSLYAQNMIMHQTALGIFWKSGMSVWALRLAA